MELLHSAILGIIQGLTEFLPISSSGHLLAVPKILNWSYHGKSFDVALHIGTFISLIIYYKKTLVQLFKDFINSFRHMREIKSNHKYKLPWFIFISSIPAGAFGLLFNDFIEEKFSSIPLTAIVLILFGILLGISDSTAKSITEIDKLDLKQALIIGFSQILALIPGVSRSGVTITSGLFSGLSKKAAANFSFLISIPIVGGAALYESAKMFMGTGVKNEINIFIVGIIASGISGYFVIKFLLEYIKKGSMQIFMYYRIVFGLLLLALHFWGTIK